MQLAWHALLCAQPGVASGLGTFALFQSLSTSAPLLAFTIAQAEVGVKKRPPPLPLLCCGAGVFMLVPLRKLFILEYNLPYPSGTATGELASVDMELGWGCPAAQDTAGQAACLCSCTCVSVVGCVLVQAKQHGMSSRDGAPDTPRPCLPVVGMMINSFFTKEGGETAKRQIRSLGIWGAFSFLFDFFKWFWTGNGE